MSAPKPPEAVWYFDEYDQVEKAYDQVRSDPAAGDQVEPAGRVWMGFDPGAGDKSAVWVSYVDEEGGRRYRAVTADEGAYLLTEPVATLDADQALALGRRIVSLPGRRGGKSYFARFARLAEDLGAEAAFRALYMGSFVAARWPTLQQLGALEQIRDRRWSPPISSDRYDQLYERGWIDHHPSARYPAILTKSGREVLNVLERADLRSLQDETFSK